MSSSKINKKISLQLYRFFSTCTDFRGKVLKEYTKVPEVGLEYGRVFPSKTLRNVPAFARAFAQAYARANAQAKEKGGGVIPESGCSVGVTSIFLPGQNGNGLLSCLRFCPGIAWGPESGHLDEVLPGHLGGVLPGHLDGVLPRHLDGVLPGHLDGVLPGHLDGILLASMCFAHTWMEHLPHAGANTHPDAHPDAHRDAQAKLHPCAQAKPHPCAQAKPHPCAQAKPHACALAKPHLCARAKPHPGQEPILILPGQLPGQNIEVTPMPHPNHAHHPTPFLFCLGICPGICLGKCLGKSRGTFLKVFDGNTLPYWSMIGKILTEDVMKSTEKSENLH